MLGINYSTAKTIVQTFRREKRIAKKPKRFLETRKAIKKERYIQKALSSTRLDTILSKILEDEMEFVCDKEKCLENDEKHGNEGISAFGQTKATQDLIDINPPLSMNKGISRVFSAPQFWIPKEEEEGPLEGQMSRAVGVQEDWLLPNDRKEIFYVYPEKDLDEEYKECVDYNNPVLLRSKPKPEENEEIQQRLPSISTILSACTSISRSVSHSQFEPGLTFDFSEYKQAITQNSFKRHFSQGVIKI